MAEDIVFGSIYVKEIGPHLSKALDVETDGRSAFPSTTRLTMRINQEHTVLFRCLEISSEQFRTFAGGIGVSPDMRRAAINLHGRLEKYPRKAKEGISGGK